MNLKVRVKQKWFWITLIPLLFLLFDQVVEIISTVQSITMGAALYESALMTLVIQAIGVIFAILALIGFPVDLTTEGYGDSKRALTYEEPAPCDVAWVPDGKNVPKTTKTTKSTKKAK